MTRTSALIRLYLVEALTVFMCIVAATISLDLMRIVIVIALAVTTMTLFFGLHLGEMTAWSKPTRITFPVALFSTTCVALATPFVAAALGNISWGSALTIALLPGLPLAFVLVGPLMILTNQDETHRVADEMQDA